MKMSMGNRVGAKLGTARISFAPAVGSFLVEYASADGEGKIGETVAEYALTLNGDRADMAKIEAAYEARLNGVFPATVDRAYAAPETFSFAAPAHRHVRREDRAARAC